MLWILPLIGLILFEALADILAKEWSLGRQWFWMFAIGSYIVANSFWLFSLKNGSGWYFYRYRRFSFYFLVTIYS